MREIKFRAWDKKLSLWFKCVDSLERFFAHVEKDPERFEIFQYTGLKDINEREVYEGDILERVHMNMEQSKDPIRSVGVVGFKNGRFFVMAVDGLCGRGFPEFIFESPSLQSEIIGNIYETP